MKINKLKALSIAVCCMVVTLWSETQCMDSTDITGNLLENGVIVRIWSSGVSGGQNVGHASLQTNFDYISFWPPEDSSSSTGYFNTLDEDYVDEEGRNPEITIFLKNPNSTTTTLIHEDFEFLKHLLTQEKLNWALNGRGQQLKNEFTQTEFDRHCQSVSILKEDSHIFGAYDNWSFNCSSIVYNILLNKNYLLEGGIMNIGGLNTCMAPDQVAQICSLNFLSSNFGSDYRALCEFEMKQRGVGSLMSFQEKYIGYYFFRTENKNVFYNENFLDLAAGRLQSINNGGFGIQLLEMFSSIGISELFSSTLGNSNSKK